MSKRHTLPLLGEPRIRKMSIQKIRVPSYAFHRLFPVFLDELRSRGPVVLSVLGRFEV